MAARAPVAKPCTREPPRFDRIAQMYRWAEYLLLGPWLVRTRKALLPLLRGRQRALVLGDGDGRFCAALLRAYPELTATALDGSGAMLALLRQRCRFASGRLQTAQLDLRHLPWGFAAQGTDLVVAHFVFDCLTQDELDGLLARIADTLPSGTMWLVSDFGYPHRQPWRFFGQVYIRALYVAFRLLTGLQVRHLPEVGAAMQRAHFRRLARIHHLGGLLYSELWERETRQRAPATAQLPFPGTHPPQL